MSPEAPQPHVIIVGGGLAGLSAALEAGKLGIRVTLVDKADALGGNSAKASSGINGAPTRAQQAAGVVDTPQLFAEDTIRSGHGLCQDELVHALAADSAAAINFLESFGLDLSLLSQLGGSAVPRTHRTSMHAINGRRPRNVGWEITNACETALRAQPPANVTILTKATVSRLLLAADGSVEGVAYSLKTADGVSEAELRGTAVLLATGGFSADVDGYLRQYAPQWENFPTTNAAIATGDGVRMAETQVGAQLLLMDQVQVHPTAFVDPKDPAAGTKFLAAEALRGHGAILVNQHGRRFVDELGYRDHVTAEILKHCEVAPLTEGAPAVRFCWMLVNREIVNAFEPEAMAFYKFKGFVLEFESADAFARARLSDDEGAAAILRDTLAVYAKAVSGEAEDPFGKKVFPIAFDADAPLTAMAITPAVHYTMGGVKISTHGEVMSKEDVPIPNLYAAGEVTGGVHGSNRLGGNSLLECVVFGRAAMHHIAERRAVP